MWPPASVRICSFRPLTCTKRRRSSSAVALFVQTCTPPHPTTSDKLSSCFTLNHIWDESGGGWDVSTCTHRLPHSHTHTVNPPTHPYIQETFPLSPECACLSDVHLFSFRGLVVACDLLFFPSRFCKIWTGFEEEWGKLSHRNEGT